MVVILTDIAICLLKIALTVLILSLTAGAIAAILIPSGSEKDQENILVNIRDIALYFAEAVFTTIIIGIFVFYIICFIVSIWHSF